MSRSTLRRHRHALAGVGIAVAALLATASPAAAGFGWRAEFGSSGSGDGELVFPVDVAADNTSDVFVTDSGNSRVQRFSHSGAFETAWGTLGSDPGQFLSPAGIDTDGTNVYVADQGNHRVQKFDASGTHLLTFGSGAAGNSDLDLSAPSDVAVAANGNVFVTEINSSEVTELEADGDFVRRWGGLAQLSSPRGIVTDGSHLWVADTGNNRIVRYDMDGTDPVPFGSFGSGAGQLDQPYGLAIEGLPGSEGPELHVAERNNHRVSVFDRTDGTFLRSYGQNGSDPGDLAAPTGIGFNPSTDAFYVVSSDPPSVQLFGDTTSITINHSTTSAASFVDFPYAAGGGLTPSSFSLDDDSNATLADTQIFSGIAPGTYSITMSDALFMSGRTLAITCSGAATAPTEDEANRTVSITIATGENVVCDFVYSNLPLIEVKLDAQPDDGQEFGFTFSGAVTTSVMLDDDGGTDSAFENGLQTLSQLGSVTITQDAVPSGWELASITCLGDTEGPLSGDTGTRSVTVDLVADEVVTCTFTNAQPGSITIVKDAQGLRGAATDAQDFAYVTSGGLSPVSFSLDDDADGTLPSSRTFADLLPGTFTLTEGAVSGWSLTGLVCDTGEAPEPLVRKVTVTLEGGEDVTCTFTNSRRQPDALGRRSTDPVFLGSNVYDPTAPGTPKLSRNAKRNQAVQFRVRVQNDGGSVDAFKILGSKSTSGFSVSYVRGGFPITGQVWAGTHQINNLAVNATSEIIVTVRPLVNAPIGARKTVNVYTTSVGAPTKKDVVTFEVKVVP
jgi:hypothetical protein